MTIEQIRDRYIIKAEKNATNDSITTDNLRFCLLFNESQNKFLTLQLQNRKVDDIRYIQNFLVLDKSIPYTSKNQDKTNFKLPDDYFDLAEARAKAKKDNCSDLITLFEVRTENLNEILQDEFNKPSFEWREAPYTVNSNQISVYNDWDFSVTELLLNYYRYPNHKGKIIINGDASGDNRSCTSEFANYVIIKKKLERFGYEDVDVRIKAFNPPIKNRIMAFNSKIRSADGEIKLFIDKKCDKLLYNIYNLRYKEGSSKIDLPSYHQIKQAKELKFLGHPMDAASYLVEFYWPISI